MKQTILTAIFCLFVTINSFSQTFSGGNGTELNPYKISSKSDMEALATAVNNGNNYSGKYFLVTRNLSGITTVIGGNINNYIRPFSGTFNGGGHTISVNIDISSSSILYVGVFGYSNGIIKNLGVKGTVSAYSDADYAMSYVGGICGYYSAGRIDSCYNSANIGSSIVCNSSSIHADSYAGGISGYTVVTAGEILNCYNDGTISSSVRAGTTAPPVTLSTSAYAGGICGYAVNVKVTNCYNTGNLSSSPLANGSGYAGGICGYFSGIQATISNSFSANTVITNTDSSNSGRIATGTGTIVNCYALSSLKINGSTVSSTNANGKDGKDETLTSFKTQIWNVNNLNWNFSTVWTMSDAGSANKGLPILAGVIPPIPVGITGFIIANREYNGTNTASISNSGTLTGVLSGDNVSIGSTSGITASFNNKNVGNGKPVVLNGEVTLSGANADKYLLTQPTGLTANITPKGSTITGLTIANKEYDATTTATVSSWGTLSGVISEDDVQINANGITASFNNKNVGNNKPVTLNKAITLSGADAGNYTLTQPTGLTANITPRSSALTITGLTIANKEYDGNATATISNWGTLTGVLSGDNVSINTSGITASFNDKNVGNNKPVTLSKSITLSGADAGNYTLTQPTLTANLTAKKITVTANPQSKIYGKTDPALTYTQTPNLIAGDQFTGGLTRDPGENMGTYSIRQGTLSAGNNYAIDFKGALFTILGSPVAELDELLINNEPVDISGNSITYTLSCDINSVNIGAAVKENGIASINGHALPYTISPEAGTNTLPILITSQDGNHTKTYTVDIIKPLEGVVVQVWDDVLSVINVPANNGGYSFATFQWQENGVNMLGETSGNLYLADNSNASTSVYTVLLSTIKGLNFQSCPVSLTSSQKMPLRVYPNPIQNTATVESLNMSAGDLLNIYDMNGQMIKIYKATGNHTEINLTGLKIGTYILKVNNEQVKLFKK
ncbi:MAG: YDG domain-containing protein [Candidatus Symbiothrix sp.]|jgi:uncharacterized membrane protein|nr:YDG domain-containing protein [Candidatus Symbiothrix sp.]